LSTRNDLLAQQSGDKTQPWVRDRATRPAANTRRSKDLGDAQGGIEPRQHPGIGELVLFDGTWQRLSTPVFPPAKVPAPLEPPPGAPQRSKPLRDLRDLMGRPQARDHGSWSQKPGKAEPWEPEPWGARTLGSQNPGSQDLGDRTREPGPWGTNTTANFELRDFGTCAAWRTDLGDLGPSRFGTWEIWDFGPSPATPPLSQSSPFFASP